MQEKHGIKGRLKSLKTMTVKNNLNYCCKQGEWLYDRKLYTVSKNNV